MNSDVHFSLLRWYCESFSLLMRSYGPSCVTLKIYMLKSQPPEWCLYKKRLEHWKTLGIQYKEKKTMWGHRNKEAICKPGERPLRKPNLFTDTLIFNVQIPQLWKINFLIYATQFVIFWYGRPSKLIQMMNCMSEFFKIIFQNSFRLLK